MRVVPCESCRGRSDRSRARHRERSEAMTYALRRLLGARITTCDTHPLRSANKDMGSVALNIPLWPPDL